MRPLPPHRVRSQRSAAGAVLRPPEEPGICSRRPCPRSRWGESSPGSTRSFGVGPPSTGARCPAWSSPGWTPTCGSSPTSEPNTRHPNKSKTWAMRRYFGKFNKFRNDRWVVGDRSLVSGRGEVAHLLKFSWTNIVRHQTVNGTASPDDPALTKYWAARRRRIKPPLDSCTLRLLEWQGGRCRSAETPCSPPTSHPAPLNNGRTGGRQSPARPSGTTSSCTTDGRATRPPGR